MEAEGPREGLPSFGTLLRRHRLAAGLTQAALAERARLSTIGISALERGFRQTPQRETLALLAGALALSDDQRRAFEAAAASVASPRRRGASVTVGPWPSSSANLPLPPTNFVGRGAELAALQTALTRGSVAAICGLGGVGKSSLAREYAARNGDHYSVILWLDAQAEDGIIDGLLGFGATFVPGLDQIANRRVAAQQVVNSVLRGFEKPPLLIFDNLEEERHLRTWLPRTGAHALITSRNAMPGPGVSTIPLQAWPLATAAEYLQRESARTDLTEADAQAIAKTLGMLPLALSHAGASLRTMRMLTPERYLKHVAAHLKDAPLGVDYPQSVFATFKTAITQVEHEAAGAAAALCFAASFAPDAIPDELFRQPIETYAEGLQPTVSGSEALDLRSLLADEVRLDAVLGALDRISLLVYSESSQTYSVHRLVQLAVHDLISASARAWRECAVVVADAAFPDAPSATGVAFAAWPQCARLLPHARAALGALPRDAVSLPAGRLAHRCGVYLRERGEYDAAIALSAQALAIRERSLGSEHSDVVPVLTNLGLIFWDQGDYEQAAAVHKRALAIREKEFGSNHPAIAVCIANLALVCADQGRYREAALLHTRALTIYEETFGPDDSLVGLCLNNLGLVYYDQGHYEEAETVQSRALANWEKSLGPNHPQVGVALSNLANTYYQQTRYLEAETLLLRAMTILENGVGTDHASFALSLNNLAKVYREQGRYDEAEALFLRALAIREKSLGPAHPYVATTLYDFAELHRARGRSEEAEQLYLRAVTIQEKAFGPDHHYLAAHLCDFAQFYEAQGRGEDAQLLYARALAIKEKVLGAGHAATRTVRERLKGTAG
jgi:tetratricopeptide (TPR) repeat protein/transcriptional regulator with XRE-family HTH domain